MSTCPVVEPVQLLGAGAGKRLLQRNVLITLSGDYDLSVADALARDVDRAAASRDRDVILDASAVTFMDAAAVRVLIKARLELATRRRSLLVRNPAACVRRLLEICDLQELIQ